MCLLKLSNDLKYLQIENCLLFVLAQWEPLSPGHTFYLGEQVYFLAQAGTLLAGERLYVDSCQATSSEDPSSLPKVDIITNYGYEPANINITAICLVIS